MSLQFVKRHRCIVSHIKTIFCYAKNFSSSSLSTHVPSITSCNQLATWLDTPSWYNEYRVIDARWDLDDNDYLAKHFEKRIQGSKFFSFDECRDKTSELPRMLPSPDEFSAYVSNLGISNDHHIIVYDDNETHGLYSSPRVWWMFRVFGHDKVSVLDGGFRKWHQDGYPIVLGEYSKEEVLPSPSKRFSSVMRSWLVKDFEFIQRNSQSANPIQIVDARGRQRFLGLTKEGEIDESSGHIPQSYSTPFNGILDKETREIKSKTDVENYLSSNGVDLSKDVISSCGSGVTACIVALAAHHVSGKDIPVYDGSWSEWKLRGTIDRGKN